MTRLLLIAVLLLYTVLDARLAPSWTSDAALWLRVVQVSPLHARAMVNLGHALAVRGQTADAVQWWEQARKTALADPSLPDRERRLVIAAANQNLVAILQNSATAGILVGTCVTIDAAGGRDELHDPCMTDNANRRIGELLEEAWRLAPNSFNPR